MQSGPAEETGGQQRGGIPMCIRDQVHSMIEKQLVCNSIAEGFPDDLAALTEGDLDAAPCLHRMDFTGDNVFTIDSWEYGDPETGGFANRQFHFGLNVTL